MKKNKIITIILSGALVVSLGSVSAQAMQNQKNDKVKNNILLTNQVKQPSGSACVVNGGNTLALTNESGQVVSYLSVGQMLKIEQNNGAKSLVQIKNTGVKGYISNANMLSIYNYSANNITSMNEKAYIINVSSSVNFRKEPSMNSTVIQGLSNNTIVQITGKVGQWYRVNVNGQTGFIFGEYVSKSSNQISSDKQNTTSKPSNVINSNNNNQTVTKPNTGSLNNTTNTDKENNSNINKPGNNNNQVNNNTGNGNHQGNTTEQVKPGTAINKGWKTIDGDKYFFLNNGEKAVGYIQIKADGTESEKPKDMETPMYYFNKAGVMQTGWVGDNYFNKDGIMQTGWHEMNGKYYFWEPDGEREIGEVPYNGNHYWLNEDGTMYKGFKDNYGICYFNQDGIKVSGWQIIDNHKYYFNENDGIMQTGWVSLGGKTYYFNDKGIMQTGKQTIEGKQYEFNNNGELVDGSHNYKMAKNLQEIMNVKSGSMQGIINKKPVEVLLQNNIKIISSNEIETKVIYTNNGGTKSIRIQDNSGQLVFYVYNSNGTLDTLFQTNKETYISGDKTTIKYVYNPDLTHLKFELNN